jgi:pilus assembly protein Flp/PilA
MREESNSGLWARFKKRVLADAGVTSVEYALIAALIAVIIIGSVAAVGSELTITYEYVANCVKNLSCQ